MHELSLLQALVEQVTELSHQEGFGRVVEIRLGVGSLSSGGPIVSDASASNCSSRSRTATAALSLKK